MAREYDGEGTNLCGGRDEMPDLNFVHSDIDPATVKPLDPRELALLINEFLLRSADILNTFCAKFEQRILQLESRLDSFDRLLALMERKLEDIPIGEHSVAKIEVVNKIPKMEENAAEEEGDKATTSGRMEAEEAKTPEGTKTEEKVEDGGMIRARDHPTLAKYFRMLKLGVPEPAVQQKMRSEGADVGLLGDPDKLVPAATSPHKKDVSGHSSSSPFSSSAEDDNDSPLSSFEE